MISQQRKSTESLLGENGFEVTDDEGDMMALPEKNCMMRISSSTCCLIFGRMKRATSPMASLYALYANYCSIIPS